MAHTCHKMRQALTEKGFSPPQAAPLQRQR
jgi:hypothetical protein